MLPHYKYYSKYTSCGASETGVAEKPIYMSILSATQTLKISQEIF